MTAKEFAVLSHLVSSLLDYVSPVMEAKLRLGWIYIVIGLALLLDVVACVMALACFLQ